MSDQREASTDEAALALVLRACTADVAQAVSSMRGHTPLSDDSLRSELLCLRVSAVCMACHGATEHSGEIKTAVLEAVDSFYGLLIGGNSALMPNRKGMEAILRLRDGALVGMLDVLRASDPQRYQRVEEMRILAPNGDTLNSRIKTYWQAFREPDVERALENVGTRFCTYCQAESDPVLQSIGETEFTAMAEWADEYLARVALQVPIEAYREAYRA